MALSALCAHEPRPLNRQLLICVKIGAIGAAGAGGRPFCAAVDPSWRGHPLPPRSGARHATKGTPDERHSQIRPQKSAAGADSGAVLKSFEPERALSPRALAAHARSPAPHAAAAEPRVRPLILSLPERDQSRAAPGSRRTTKEAPPRADSRATERQLAQQKWTARRSCR
jgi:hypothetical protein